jgi:cytochrome c oxidase cbb3-type subunit III
MDKSKQEMEVHHYDGIEEQDNPIPVWFSTLFWVTVIFGIGYYGYYELGDGTSLRATYEKNILVHEALVADSRGKAPKTSEEDLLALTKNPEEMKSARANFETKCFSCHGVKGQGGIGPNLTDDYWLHGAKLTEIRAVISGGVLDKGMPPWESSLSSKEMDSLAAYIRTLHGTHPSGAKAPQGELVKAD